MKLGLQRTVPIATERFHDALDELENEVRLAQTVLRRDLALMKEDRKKRDAAAKQQEVEIARLAAEARNAPSKALAAPVVVEKVSTPVPPEAPAEPEPEAKPIAKAEEPEISAKREEENIPPPIKTNIDTPPRDPLFDATPTTANPQESEFDFDAIFGDAMDTSGGDNQDDMMDTSGAMDFSLDGGNDGPSLLRGLEDFAKDSDDDNAAPDAAMDIDFAIPDLPDLNITATALPEPEPEVAPKPDVVKPAAQPPVAQPVAEETKDTKVEDELMGTMVTDDLEDLFNMDDYENPENSSFDDAFFNFGD